MQNKSYAHIFESEYESLKLLDINVLLGRKNLQGNYENQSKAFLVLPLNDGKPEALLSELDGFDVKIKLQISRVNETYFSSTKQNQIHMGILGLSENEAMQMKWLLLNRTLWPEMVYEQDEMSSQSVELSTKEVVEMFLAGILSLPSLVASYDLILWLYQ